MIIIEIACNHILFYLLVSCNICKYLLFIDRFHSMINKTDKLMIDLIWFNFD